MKTFFSLIALFTFTTTAFAEKEICHFSIEKDSHKVTWTGFKTEKKVGVDGSFDKVILHFSKNSFTTLESLINGTSFEIDASTVNSKNPERDGKLKNLFFGKMKTPKITGNVLSVDAATTTAQVSINLNKVKQTIPMTYVVNEGRITLTGSIEMLKWKLDDSYKAISEACKVLHSGKTWTDVNIKIDAKLDESCKK